MEKLELNSKIRLNFRNKSQGKVQYPSIVGTVSNLTDDGAIIRNCGKNNIIACNIYNKNKKVKMLVKNLDTGETYSKDYILTDINLV